MILIEVENDKISVFEIIANDTKIKALEAKLATTINPKEDSLRIYHICENCLLKSKVLCNEKEPFFPAETIVM